MIYKYGEALALFMISERLVAHAFTGCVNWPCDEAARLMRAHTFLARKIDPAIVSAIVTEARRRLREERRDLS